MACFRVAIAQGRQSGGSPDRHPFEGGARRPGYQAGQQAHERERSANVTTRPPEAGHQAGVAEHFMHAASCASFKPGLGAGWSLHGFELGRAAHFKWTH